MKVSDAVAEFLSNHVKHVFVISGGASLHLIHSIAARKDMFYVCPQSEQAASFAADAYARINGVGCAIATSGPGATNLVTGIATSYYDSVPVLFLTGNQTRARLRTFGTRQLGFQATPITEVCKPITKYAVQVAEPSQVVKELNYALKIMREGRPGPALVDLPDDVQRAEI